VAALLDEVTRLVRKIARHTCRDAPEANMRSTLRSTLGPALALALLAACSTAGAASDVVKVFILVGQSNMLGQADPVTYRHQFTDARTRDVFAPLLDARGEVRTRDDVFYSFRDTHAPLTVGLDPRNRFGPELGFGWVVGDAIDEPVLIIKAAWGGRSLFHDFRSPSAGLPDEAFLQKELDRAVKRTRDNNERHKKSDPLPTIDDIKAGYGFAYREMMAEVKAALANYASHHPKLAGKRTEIAGFVWFQGWNDMINPEYSAAYTENMRHFIRDVRKDLAAPDMPFVIGQLGVDGRAANEKAQLFKDNQAKAAEGMTNVAVVKTDVLWDEVAAEKYKTWRDDLDEWRKYGNDHPYHYLASPLTIYRIGDAFGRQMVKLRGG
jgi:alpha-galactosidase